MLSQSTKNGPCLKTTSPGHLGKVKHGADVQGAEAVYEEYNSSENAELMSCKNRNCLVVVNDATG